ncbi:NADH-quinone oxidoreductase subunit L [bacterium]|nr:MAG: NADH-quinone oxidoreductase subunit L [bacterium]RIK63350.1 MAG: NADH-quinone oxidoreductase subunit L [Planctomycetota bacterium]
MRELLQKPEFLLLLVPLMPLIGFLVNGFFGRRMALASSGAVACGSIVLSFVIATSLFVSLISKGHTVQSYSFNWMHVGALDIHFRLLADPLSGLLMMVVTGVGSLIHIYSVGYMGHDKAYWRFFAYLNLFCFAMLMLVLGDSLVLMFLGWEGVGLCSYLLIGFWYTHKANSDAGKKAFVVNRVGDFGFMLGMFLLFWYFGSLNYGELAAGMREVVQPDSTLLNAACLCLFVGACGKSAQIPLYVWLPDAMAGPTPVSALIHAATMVTAGIYMIARLNFIWVHAETALTVVALVGALTAFFAGTIGLVQRDIKKVLAYSTVSQLGFMFMALGLGNFPVAIFHLFTHAFFKALLFLGSGSVIHSLEHTLGHGNPDSQDLFKMGGLKHKMPLTFATMLVGACGLAGIPLFSGFFSKDAILYAAFERQDALGLVVYALGLAAAVCTAFYSFRLIGLAFFGKWRGLEAAYAHADESPRSMGMPLFLLAIAAFGAGYLWLPAAFGVHFTPFADLLAPVWQQGQAFLRAAQSPLAMPVEHSHEALVREWVNMLISSVVAVGVSIFAFTIYSKPAGLERARKLVEGGLGAPYRLLLNKYYIDEIYDITIVRPIQLLSDVFFVIFDVIFIDLMLVNGSGLLVDLSSKVARRVQTGVVRHYLFAFVVGAALLLVMFLAVL